MSSTPPVPSVVSTSDTSSMDAAQNWPTDLIPSLVAAVTEHKSKLHGDSLLLCLLVQRHVQHHHAKTASLPSVRHLLVQQRLSSRVSSDTPGQIFLSASLPIDSQVSAKLKGKIWNEEFIDFSSLLSNPGAGQVSKDVAGVFRQGTPR